MATILNLEIVSAMEWTTPRGKTEAIRGREAFLDRLRELDEERDEGEWLSVWGYHAPYHGGLSRSDLDAISTTRPIFVWQRSVHEMYFNTRARVLKYISCTDRCQTKIGRVVEIASRSERESPP